MESNCFVLSFDIGYPAQIIEMFIFLIVVATFRTFAAYDFIRASTL